MSGPNTTKNPGADVRVPGQDDAEREQRERAAFSARFANVPKLENARQISSSELQEGAGRAMKRGKIEQLRELQQHMDPNSNDYAAVEREIQALAGREQTPLPPPNTDVRPPPSSMPPSSMPPSKAPVYVAPNAGYVMPPGVDEDLLASLEREAGVRAYERYTCNLNIGSRVLHFVLRQLEFDDWNSAILYLTKRISAGKERADIVELGVIQDAISAAMTIVSFEGRMLVDIFGLRDAVTSVLGRSDFTFEEIPPELRALAATRFYEWARAKLAPEVLLYIAEERKAIAAGQRQDSLVPEVKASLDP